MVSHTALDFATFTIHAFALLTLSASHSSDVLLDTCTLAVHTSFTTANPLTLSSAPPTADARPVPDPEIKTVQASGGADEAKKVGAGTA